MLTAKNLAAIALYVVAMLVVGVLFLNATTTWSVLICGVVGLVIGMTIRNRRPRSTGADRF